MEAKFVALALVGLFCVAAAKKVEMWEPCPGDSVDGSGIKSIDIEPCPQEPCLLYKGTLCNMTVKYVAKESADDLWLDAVVKAGFFHRNYPHFNHKACEYSSPKCPVEKSKEYTLAYNNLEVPHEFPSAKGVVTVTLKDDKNRDKILTCAKVKVEYRKKQD